MNKEFYENHFEDCDYCFEISERKDLPEVEKGKLINDHTINAYAGMADMVYDQWKDREVI
jgi:hypothetical protein